MTNEFKKISKNNETRYVLEDGSSTTSASVASIDTPLGGMQRRTSDNILAQEADKKKVPATKPRNFVAKNAKMGGAGQHKDKKKAQKQGDVKHKKPLAENVDNLEIALQQARQITKMIKYDDTVTDIVVKIQALAEKFNIDANDIRYAIDDVYEAKQKLESVVYGLDEIFEDALRNARYAADDETDFNEDWGKGGYDTYSAGNHGRGVAEEDDVQQELGMAGSELYGIAKHAKELLALIKQHGQQQGLEAWQQSKITKAADYLNAVLQSLDYDTHSDEQGVAEGLESSIDLLKKLDAMIKNFVQTRGQMGGQRLSAGMLPILNNLEQLGEKDIAHGIKNMVLDARNSERATKGASWSVLAQGLSQKLPELIRNRMKQGVAEGWSQKYKSSINCSHPKGFSQKAHCAGKKKHNEGMMTMEAVCPDCGMCQTHGNINEIKKGQKDSNGFTKCWPGKHAAGTKKGKNGGQVRNCVPNESLDPYFESLTDKLAEKLDPNAPVDVWIQDFQKADPNRYRQFKNKTPEKKAQMAVAASYGAKNPSKKK